MCDLEGHVHADAVTVDALARLRLTAGRLGCAFLLRGVPRELAELIELVGLREPLCG